jgi:hypothetical protein
MMEIALRCVSVGWYIFPLGVKSKLPDANLAPHGFKSASNDPEQIRTWWTASPDSNIGIDLGRSNLTVLDFDNGLPPAELGLQDRFQVSTSRGTHVYFDGVSKQVDMYLNGQHIGEVKSDGGYVLAPFSRHPDGPVYTITVKNEITPVPDGLLERLRPERKSSPTLEGPKIPYGQHDIELTRIGGKLRQFGMEEESIYDAITEVCEKRCEGYGADYKDMTRKIAHSICRYPVVNTDLALTQQPTVQSQTQQMPNKPDVSNWLSMFRSVEEMEDGPIVMVIEGVLQEGTCFIGANPGDGKTLIGLAFAKAISIGTALFGLPEYPVKEARTVIYLIPESRDRAFRKRCEAFRMPTDKMKFMARTISAGASLELGDPYLLEAVRQTKAVVFLDTASRFMKGTDENAAAQNRQLVNDVIALLAAGAVCVVLLHHATKASKQKQEVMTLENMLRGSSDLGAMCDQAYGIRKDMLLYQHGSGPMEIDMVNLKDREQIGGLTSIRLAASYKKEGMDFPVSYINETGNFKVVNNAETYKRELENLVRLIENDRNIPAKELAQQTRLTEYAVKHRLATLGWHRVQGGQGGASPWHQDNDMPCPFAKEKRVMPKKVSKPPKPGIAETVEVTVM